MDRFEFTGEPSYLRLHGEGKLAPRIRQAQELLRNCCLCPRQCNVDRTAGQRGFCRMGHLAKVAAAHAHFGEEAPLVGQGGSGTIFMSSCNLLCSFCQNYEISHLSEGREVEPSHLAALMLQLMGRGCHNINFVTPTHFVPQILHALGIAVDAGLNIPLVYNCGGYESVETLRLLESIFDIYMPDFKFWDEKWADLYCKAPDYRVHATAAIQEMHRQVGNLLIDPDGLAIRGLLVRHLVMPGGVANSKEILNFIAREVSPETYVNVMAQYHPCGAASGDEIINRRITRSEYIQAIDWAIEAGLTRLDSRSRI